VTDIDLERLPFEHDQLIVDLPHQRLVCNFLTERLHLPQVTVVETHARLGLALLRLSGVADRARAGAADRPDDAARSGNKTKPAPDPLDSVLRDLRAELGKAFDGWLPDMGKNRDVAGIVTLPGSKGAFNEPAYPVGPAGWDQVVLEANPEGVPGPVAGRGVRVGVLDTKLFKHPELAGAYVAPDDGYIEIGSTAKEPGDGHATFVAGLVHAHAPAAGLVADWMLNENVSSALTWETVKKLARFIDSGVDILNLSFGSRTFDGQPPFALRRAIERLTAQMLVVASAGNHGESGHPDAAMFPAALPGVIAVGATDNDGHPASFSPNLPWITCVAPGVDVLSTYLGSAAVSAPVSLHVEDDRSAPTVPTAFRGFARWKGTSFAAANVTGAIAARTVPGRVPAKDAFERLLDEPRSKVRRFDWRELP
jgi:hypothetical protein